MQLVLEDRCFQWTFLLAAIQCPIIGVDFLRTHHLLLDPFIQQQALGLIDSLVYEG